VTNPGNGVRVVVVDDAVLIREGIVSLLSDAGFDVIAQRGDAEGLVEFVKAERPDVVVLDIRMPPTHTCEGLDAARAIRAAVPAVGLLLLSQYVETRSAVDLIGDDASGIGYLLKDRVADLDAFIAAVRSVAAGGTVIDQTVISRLVSRNRRRSLLDSLTEREQDVLSVMAEGRSNGWISEQLNLSPKTVETHIRSIFTKLGLEVEADDHRRVRAVLLYLGDR
jgi:DNA-binding NarL/FixJ family response regulator